MCVAALAWDAHPDWLLVAIGNRDEFHARASAPLARWDDGSGIIAGCDLVGGGTWLGVTDAGRFALVTNYRVPEGPQAGRPSRGVLVTDLLRGRTPARTQEMNPFNLVHAAGQSAGYLGNFPQDRAEPLQSGLHGLSNGGFDDPWPKTRALQAALADWLAGSDARPDALFAAMRDETPLVSSAKLENGPDVAHSSVFIRNPVYGTRCSTFVAVPRSGRACIVERRFDPDGRQSGETAVDFDWPTE